ncbi:MAG TPA: response regulator [Candidatus Acidoferrum sp.]|nr:response regulator [Candidatus Acidoferrum sp.]
MTASADYSRGMKVQVIFPYAEHVNSIKVEQQARVVRVTELSGGWRAVAVTVGHDKTHENTAAPAAPVSHETQSDPSHSRVESPRGEPKPLVLIVDSETSVLENLRGTLTNEGYEVIAVNNVRDGHEILKLFTPAMVIAEIEGEGFPGYALCAHAKETPRLQHVPVVLVTSGGNPSDYRGAYVLGAVVCVTKRTAFARGPPVGSTENPLRTLVVHTALSERTVIITSGSRSPVLSVSVHFLQSEM